MGISLNTNPWRPLLPDVVCYACAQWFVNDQARDLSCRAGLPDDHLRIEIAVDDRPWPSL